MPVSVTVASYNYMDIQGAVWTRDAELSNLTRMCLSWIADRRAVFHAGVTWRTFNPCDISSHHHQTVSITLSASGMQSNFFFFEH